MIKKQMIAVVVLGTVFGFGNADAMKQPYIVYPDEPGKDQYFSASKTIPCKIYEVDFYLKNEQVILQKKMRVIQVSQSDESPNILMIERYGNYVGKWYLEGLLNGLELGLPINDHEITLKADMNSAQIVSQLAQLGTVTKEDSTINFLREKKTKK